MILCIKKRMLLSVLSAYTYTINVLYMIASDGISTTVQLKTFEVLTMVLKSCNRLSKWKFLNVYLLWLIFFTFKMLVVKAFISGIIDQ